MKKLLLTFTRQFGGASAFRYPLETRGRIHKNHNPLPRSRSVVRLRRIPIVRKMGPR